MPGVVGLELPNPAASYLIGIFGTTRLELRASAMARPFPLELRGCDLQVG